MTIFKLEPSGKIITVKASLKLQIWLISILKLYVTAVIEWPLTKFLFYMDCKYKMEITIITGASLP
jgi:hypothetical protein